MPKKDILNLVSEIYNALNTLELKGYSNCKTFSNCMDALNTLVNELNTAIPDEKIED